MIYEVLSEGCQPCLCATISYCEITKSLKDLLAWEECLKATDLTNAAVGFDLQEKVITTHVLLCSVVYLPLRMGR